jgi:hypothetical protein
VIVTDPNDSRLEQIATNRRHFSALRFAIMTVFMASTGGLLQLWPDRNKFGPDCKALISGSGIVLAAVFLIFQVRIAMMNRHLDNVVREIEGTAVTNSLTGPVSAKAWDWIIGIATGLLYVLAIVVWIVLWIRN